VPPFSPGNQAFRKGKRAEEKESSTRRKWASWGKWEKVQSLEALRRIWEGVKQGREKPEWGEDSVQRFGKGGKKHHHAHKTGKGDWGK